MSVPTTPVAALLWPRLRGITNRWLRASRGERATYVVFSLLGLGFLVGVYGFMAWLVGAFHDVEVFGPILTRRLLELLLLGLFGLLVFSNVVVALSTYYLSEDLELVLALPIGRSSFFYARLLDTLAQSSWMMAVFGLPVFVAYGVAYGASPAYYPLALLVLASFVLVPAALGIGLASVLVSVFPARRLRELLVLAGILALVAVFVAVRWVRPERLVNAENFESLAAYVAELQAPVPLLFPPRWASDVLLASLGGRPMPWLELAMVVVGGVAAVGLSRWLTSWLYDRGRARAQEARAARLARAGWLDRVIALWTFPLSGQSRALVTKDIKTFFRDPAQWSQLFLLASIVIISLTSVSALPVGTFKGAWMGVFRNLLAFLVLGLVGFVLSAVAARFQFTAVSGEKRGFWIVRSGPLDARRFLWAKMYPGLAPMLLIGEILAVASTWILGAGPFLVVTAAGTALGLALGISGLAVGMGATFPDFKVDNVARAASGPPAVLFMVSALGLVGAVIGLEAYPVYLVLRGQIQGSSMTPAQLAASAVLLLAAAGLCAAATVVPVHRGARHLWDKQGLP